MKTTAVPRKSRATMEQLSKMTDFLLENPGLADGSFRKLYGKFKHDKKWSEMTEMLNSLGGAVKNVHQWSNVWKELKSRTNIKFRVPKVQKSCCVNKACTRELERRVMSLIRNEHIEEPKPVVNNEPIEAEPQENLHNDDSVFSDVPPLSSISGTEFEMKAFSNPTLPRNPPKSTNLDDENDAQSKFLEIAKTQADALKVLTETSIASLEIAKTQAATLNMLAECSAKSIEANKKMADAIKTMGEGLKHIANAFNVL